jgi:hypothetical protein
MPEPAAVVSGHFAPKVPLSCWFGVAIAQRLRDFDSFARAETANHGIVTVSAGSPISEFLIVGCQHGWLGLIGYDRGGFEQNRDSHGMLRLRSFLVRNLLYLQLRGGICRNGAIERTGSNGGRRQE